MRRGLETGKGTLRPRSPSLQVTGERNWKVRALLWSREEGGWEGDAEWEFLLCQSLTMQPCVVLFLLSCEMEVLCRHPSLGLSLGL